VSPIHGRKHLQILIVSSRQRTRVVNLRRLRRIAKTLLLEHLQVDEFEVGIYLVNVREMTRLNETFLQHKGSTDVLAFDYSDTVRPGLLFGEIFVCVDEAFSQSRRFRTSWQSEVARYIVHGLLHLCGYEDRQSKPRQQMKRAENRLLGQLSRQFNLRKLAASSDHAKS